MKLMVMGYARHGKDTFCDFSGLKFESSSMFCAEKVILPVLGPKYGYKNALQCYIDRDNHRPEWHELIYQYNQPDLTRLSREIFAENDIYCGIRKREEFLAAREAGLFDLAIWVDASERLPPESAESINVSKNDADIIIENNLGLMDFAMRVRTLMTALVPERAYTFAPTENLG